MNIKHKLSALLTGFILAMCVVAPLHADDIEIYTKGSLGSPTVQPNVMFIVDTSGSMSAQVDTRVPYDYTKTYHSDIWWNSYDKDYIYFTSSNKNKPWSSYQYSFLKTANNCDNSLKTYDNGAVVDATAGPLQKNGYYSDQMAQSTGSKWQAFKKNNSSTKRKYPVECAADAGIHGSNTAPTPNMWINNSGGWTNTATTPSVWSGGDGMLYLYDGNYLNYLNDSSTLLQSPSPTRLDIVKDAVKSIVDTNNNINICLMRYDKYAEGGAVMYPCTDVKASRNDFNTRLSNMTASGNTPLAETYYEALRYFGGKAVDYGKTANPSNQTGSTESGNPKFYQTPLSDVCQKNFIVYLTDGAPTSDYLSTTRQSSLASTFPTGSCDAPPAGTWGYGSNLDAFSSATATDDNCLDELSGWAKNNDVAERDTDYASHVGKQTITTYTVGFGDDVQADGDAIQLLKDTANAGGGQFYPAKDAPSLQDVFDKILGEILTVSSTFSSPAVSVNAYNRATNLDDLYFTLFKPANGPHWDGNLKKFKLTFDSNNDPFIADSTGADAVDPTSGFFKDSSISYWTQAADAPDGADPALGGAASRLTSPDDTTSPRLVYTYTGTYTNNSGVMSPATGDLTASTNSLSDTNTNITDAMLGGVASNSDQTYRHNKADVTVSYRKALLMWAEGYDIFNTTEAIQARRIMGDPLHAQPGLVQYGQTAGGDPDLVIYTATNDGYLHAFDSLTGQEYFSFVPQELLPNLSTLFDDSSSGKSYGLDGDVIHMDIDKNHDGKIDTGAGDSVYLYFGQRRGGRNIYSMDVSDRTKPKLRWMIEGGVGDFAELGQTWSAPDVATLKLGGTDRKVLVFGAGYDTAQDSDTVRTPDTVGRGIYIVDALTGKMLWRAGPDAGASTQMTNMKYSIPGRIVVLDMDGDGYIDRLYAGDMGGQLWRFDIKTSDSSTNLSSLITGGRIADLATDSDVTATRRFYYPPDVGLISEPGKAPYLSVVAVSGYRAHPLNTAVHDRAYMIRDTDVYNQPANSDYAAKMVTESDLFDTTDNKIAGGTSTSAPSAADTAAAVASLQSKQGWYIKLSELDGSFIGEKGLSEPLILNGSAIFTTYTPIVSTSTGTAGCTPNAGLGKVYHVQVVDGTPTYHTGTVGVREERNTELQRTGIPPSPNVIVTDTGVATECVGAECTKANLSNTVQKAYWYEKEQ